MPPEYLSVIQARPSHFFLWIAIFGFLAFILTAVAYYELTKKPSVAQTAARDAQAAVEQPHNPYVTSTTTPATLDSYLNRFNTASTSSSSVSKKP